MKITENFRNQLATIVGPNGKFLIRFGFSGKFIVVDSELRIDAELFDNYEHALNRAKSLAEPEPEPAWLRCAKNGTHVGGTVNPFRDWPAEQTPKGWDSV